MNESRQVLVHTARDFSKLHGGFGNAVVNGRADFEELDTLGLHVSIFSSFQRFHGLLMAFIHHLDQVFKLLAGQFLASRGWYVDPPSFGWNRTTQ